MASGRRGAQAGFTFLVMLIAVAAIGAGLAATGAVWTQARQRDLEEELLFVGNQYREAIALYYQRTPGAAKQFPASLEDLLLDRRYPNTQRYLRQLYPDPLTGKAQWGLVRAPDDRITGVYSLANLRPIKTSNFSGTDREFEGAVHFSDWRFVYQPPI